MDDVIVSFRVSIIFEDTKKAKEFLIDGDWGKHFIKANSLLDLKTSLAPELFDKTIYKPDQFCIDGLGSFNRVKNTNSWVLETEEFGKMTFISPHEVYGSEMEWI